MSQPLSSQCHRPHPGVVGGDKDPLVVQGGNVGVGGGGLAMGLPVGTGVAHDSQVIVTTLGAQVVGIAGVQEPSRLLFRYLHTLHFACITLTDRKYADRLPMCSR